MVKAHSFHIPVMGIGFTVDTPVKVAHLGISSVISLVDDMLCEKMREFHSKKFNLSFESISNKMENYRAERITAYLNMVDEIAHAKFEQLKQSFKDKADELERYIAIMPNFETLKDEMKKLSSEADFAGFWEKVKETMHMGSIDVNIMTKVDKENYHNGEKLSVEYNDAHAALRGFANSKLRASVVLSAGLNPALYSYIEKFDDFYPTPSGFIKKQIILKVSDYKSALIQGKFLAKKGLWVSEYRIESGLNCGGHAFATDGLLMGPILEEFKNNRDALTAAAFELYTPALAAKNRFTPQTAPAVRVSAQGGVGNNDEHNFLLDYYQVDSVGWGSPFLLVPEVTDVDQNTLQLLKDAKENDLYLSNISPLGVPFNNLRGNSRDVFKDMRIAAGKPGAPCTKKYVQLNKEFSDKGLCTASNVYQKKKIEELNALNLSKPEHDKRYTDITDRACICVGLGNASMIKNDIEITFEGPGVSVCPGPNLAYFSETSTLSQMVNHIYGRNNVMKRTDRPNMFLKELQLYVNHLKAKVSEAGFELPEKQAKQLQGFKANLNSGIEYYKQLFAQYKNRIKDARGSFDTELEKLKHELENVTISVQKTEVNA